MQPQSAPVLPPLGSDNQPIFLRPSRDEALRVGLVGFLVGLLVTFIGQWLTSIFVRPVFCSSGDPFGLCSGSANVGYGAALVLLGVVAVVLLANWQVFRPLVIVVAAVISLWGLEHYLQPLFTHNSWVYYVVSAGLYALIYVLFYWLMRLHNFLAGLGLTVLAIILIRLVLIQ